MPFHKLTGWTTYSLIEPIEKILGWRFDGLEDMTGLPEYRNGACIAWPASCAPLWSLTHILSLSSLGASKAAFLWTSVSYP